MSNVFARIEWCEPNAEFVSDKLDEETIGKYTYTLEAFKTSGIPLFRLYDADIYFIRRTDLEKEAEELVTAGTTNEKAIRHLYECILREIVK